METKPTEDVQKQDHETLFLIANKCINAHRDFASNLPNSYYWL